LIFIMQKVLSSFLSDLATGRFSKTSLMLTEYAFEAKIN
jgi:hypothetical protein